ncbi:helix-turn-helix domain-containing protein, partial [Streptomyces prasinus]|uniref:helix-turn-helix domain-containing protein n=1 Tax=Streptomyces prasinus TaxID=67345 RepID=UPI00200BFC0B
MTSDDVADALAAMGPRLRAAREQRGVTLTGVGCATGISPSTLSRIETGRRKPTLEVLLQLSKEYGVSLDELAGTAPAPAAGPRATAPLSFGDDKAVLPLARYVGGLHAHKHVLPALEEPPDAQPLVAFVGDLTAPLSFGDDKAVLPLARYVGGLHAHKHVLPALEEPPARPRQVSHEGYEWLCVLYGRLRLALGDQDLVLAAGDVAEFDTRTP